MKVLLVQDVEKLGQAGEVKEVAGGFGRNYLIPKGYAILATKGQIKQAEERIVARRRREEAARRDDEALYNRLNGLTLRFVERSAGELDRLYGSVTNMDIAARIQEEQKLTIDRRKIDLEDPIKRIGVYPVKIKLAQDLEPLLNIVVEAEGSELTPPDVASASASAAAETPDSDAAADDTDVVAETETEETTGA